MGLLDIFKKKEENEFKHKPLSPETMPVATDLKVPDKVNQFFDNLSYLTDPDEELKKLGGRANLRTIYAKDDEITAAIDTRHESAITSPWMLSGGDDRTNEIIRDAINPCIQDILNYSWFAVPYGFSVVQTTWDRHDGYLVPSGVYDMPFESYLIDREGNLHINHHGKKEELVQEKYLTTIRKPSFGKPMGEALLSRLFHVYLYRCHSWDFLMSFMETWSKPFLHAKVSQGHMDHTQYSNYFNAIKSSISATKRPTGLVSGSDVDVSILAAPQNSAIFDSVNKALNERIQRLILGQTLTSGTDGVGSMALGQVHHNVREDKIRSDRKMLERTIQTLVNRIYYLNNLSGDVPTFHFQDPKGLEKERSDRDQVLYDQGVRFTKEYYLDRYDLKEGDIENIEDNLNLSDNGFEEINSNILSDYPLDHAHNHKFSENRGSDTPTIKANKRLENKAIRKSNATEFSVEDIYATVLNSKNEKDLKERLGNLIEEGNTKFTDDLTQAMYASLLKGYVDAEENSDA